MTRTYASPEAFKNALESHIRNAAQQRGFGIARMRQLFIVERLLVRLHAGFGDRIITKGGLALEMRLTRARTTKYLDLRLTGNATSLPSDLNAAASSDQSDWLAFGVRPDAVHPTIEGDGVVYEGHRFVVNATLARRPNGDPFGLDVGFGDALTEAPDIVDGSNMLSFLGAERPRFRVYPRVAHVAEKLHAYTMPRARENTRTKDLPDIALLATTGSFSAVSLRVALEATFQARGTHPLPDHLPAPPVSWVSRYATISQNDDLEWKTLDAVYAVAQAFINPVLAGGTGVWTPASWGWGLEQE